MGKTKKDFTMVSKAIMMLLGAADIVLVTPYEFSRRLKRGNIVGDGRMAADLAYYLAKHGLIKYVDKNNERFVRLTNKGQLKALLEKAKIGEPLQEWDGKWRVVLFDIPEESGLKRDFFRSLLKQNGFIEFQHSVYISPYPINREALRYLKQTRLDGYIRILKVEEIDNDKDLKQKFGLK